MRCAPLGQLALTAVLALGPPALAAEPTAAPAASDAPRRPPLVLKEGSQLQLLLPQGPQEGVLVRQSPDALTLSTGPLLHTVPAREVEAISRRRNTVGRSALWGGGIGLATGALLGCGRGSLEEYQGGQKCLQYGLVAGGVSALLGLGVGAAVGLLWPGWEHLYARTADGPLVLAAPGPRSPAPPGASPPPPPLPPPPPPRAPAAVAARASSLGELRLLASGVRTSYNPADAVGGGLRLQLLARVPYAPGPGIPTALHLGPEVAVQVLQPDLTPDPREPPNPFGRTRRFTMVSPGVLMRGSLELGPLSPALLLGFAFHFPETAAFSAGVGLDWSYARGLPPLALEARVHKLSTTQQQTIGLGTRFAF